MRVFCRSGHKVLARGQGPKNPHGLPCRAFLELSGELSHQALAIQGQAREMASGQRSFKRQLSSIEVLDLFNARDKAELFP